MIKRGETIFEGIIPARAGFTICGESSVPKGRDHPRSRGVYFRGMHLDVNERGSSPLARGLHAKEHEEIGGTRIIPARAGFTDRG